jgi:hypothetical protein
MFSGNEKDYLQVNLVTTHYLGRQHVAERFLDLLFRYGGIYVPEKWDTDERTRRVLDGTRLTDIVSEWIAPTKMHEIVFHRKRPFEIQMSFSIERFQRAKFNDFSVYVRDKYFRDHSKFDELLRFCLDVCDIISADYGFICHTIQERRQSPMLTPAERLPGVYWANFFGRPYIDFFGRDKLLGTPCHAVRQISEDLIVVIADESPVGPEMLERDEIVSSIKKYLDQNAFAGPNFPDEPCAVPQFDFRDVRWRTERLADESTEQRIVRIRAELESNGYKTIAERPDNITMRGEDGSLLVIDLKSGDLSLDTTGRFLDQPGSVGGQRN